MAKQLSLSERITIERMLHGDYTFATIGRRLNRSASTISREIQSYRFFVHPVPEKGRNDCLKFHSCIRNSCCPYTESVHGCLTYRCKRCPDHNCIEFCTAYESSHCPLLDKPPYVCTGCTNELQKKCKKNHAYYTAHRADHAHHKAIKLAHSGIRKTPEELVEIGRLIKPLILNGQSLNHICTTHAKTLGVSEKTLYNYIDHIRFCVHPSNNSTCSQKAYRRHILFLLSQTAEALQCQPSFPLKTSSEISLHAMSFAAFSNAFCFS